MIIDKKININVNPNNIKYLRKLNYDININDSIEIPIEHLAINSHIKINTKCDICGIEKKITYFSYNRNIKNSGIYTCQKCSNIKKIKTSLEKYGVNYPIQSETVKQKRKNNNIKKYGIDETSKLEKTITKIKETKKIKYNNENFNNINKIKKTKKILYGNENYNNSKKSSQTNLKKYGVKNISQSELIKKKKSETYIINFGVDNYSKSQEYKNKKIDFIKNKYKNLNFVNITNNTLSLKCDKNHIYEIDINILRNRIIYNSILCTVCNPISSYSKSGYEIQLQNFINENYKKTILYNNRSITQPLELDIYIPELKLAFEFNGLYWHNELNKESNYHLKKTEECEKIGIQLIHIYEDDWLYKQDIIKSMILNKLGKIDNKIYARKCTIKEINDNKLVREFLNTNHIQGFVGSKVKLGLFYEDELVSLMTFGNRRVAMGKKETSEGEYELLRFCNKLNTNVIGGASKLFKYFIDNYKPNEITTYADRSYSQGKLYETLGFKFYSKTKPNYYYIIDGFRHHRFNYRKDRLINNESNLNKTEHQIMLENKIYRIYDSGNLKYKFNI